MKQVLFVPAMRVGGAVQLINAYAALETLARSIRVDPTLLLI